ncbi:MAG: NAD+ synthase, partial [Gammaproteobacteria bacterium]|nr:NAD+ synthase [Gammaproteobacteria bacterium]
LAQINPLVGDLPGNTELLVSVAQRAHRELSADLVIVPELGLLGYPPEDLLLRAELDARVETALRELCERMPPIALLVGTVLRREQRMYNGAVLLQDGNVVAEYHKQCLPNYGVFDEKRYFTPGRAATVVTLKGVRCGITVCEDIWEPGPARAAAQAGAQVLLNINGSPYHRGKAAERLAVIRARVQETALPICYVNLFGGQDELIFDGGSLVVDAQGECVARAALFDEDLLPIDVTPDGELITVRENPAMPDEMAEIYQAITLGVADYVNKNRFDGAVIGLSGGIDSALTLAVAVDALGAERVQVVMMPSRYTADISVEDATEQARRLNVAYRVISIEPLFEAFLSALAEEFADAPVDTTEENIQARCRGVLLMAISNKKRRIVLTTGNKSEMAVGYATLYGDMAGGFAPLKDVEKTLVYRLADYRNGLSRVIPQRVIERPPSAELAPDQVDEDSLPPYADLDAVLRAYVEEDLPAASIAARGFARDVVERVIKMVVRNEYKRRQAPPGVRITARAFGRDRRYPITSGYDRA